MSARGWLTRAGAAWDEGKAIEDVERRVAFANATAAVDTAEALAVLVPLVREIGDKLDSMGGHIRQIARNTDPVVDAEIIEAEPEVPKWRQIVNAWTSDPDFVGRYRGNARAYILVNLADLAKPEMHPVSVKASLARIIAVCEREGNVTVTPDTGCGSDCGINCLSGGAFLTNGDVHWGTLGDRAAAWLARLIGAEA